MIKITEERDKHKKTEFIELGLNLRHAGLEPATP